MVWYGMAWHGMARHGMDVCLFVCMHVCMCIYICVCVSDCVWQECCLHAMTMIQFPFLWAYVCVSFPTPHDLHCLLPRQTTCSEVPGASVFAFGSLLPFPPAIASAASWLPLGALAFCCAPGRCRPTALHALQAARWYPHVAFRLATYAAQGHIISLLFHVGSARRA